MNTREYSELQKLYSNIINEYDEAKSAASAEKNLQHSFNRPGSQAPGYKYSGRMAPNRNGSGQVPEQKRVQQDLKAATQRSQQRQLQMNSYDPFEIVKNHLLDEGYASDERSAFAIMASMSEGWKQSILEMDDFAAGGGNAKMKATGMTKDQVISLGKKNLAAKPASSSSSSGKSSGSTPSDAVRDRLASREKYRDTVNQARAAGVRGPVGLMRKQAAQDQEAKFNAYYDKQRNDPYYKIKSFKDIPGTFKNG